MGIQNAPTEQGKEAARGRTKPPARKNAKSRPQRDRTSPKAPIALMNDRARAMARMLVTSRICDAWEEATSTRRLR
jgi:hypothetical protein